MHHIAIQRLVQWPLMGGLFIGTARRGLGVCGPPSPLLAVPNVKAHPSMAIVPTAVLLYDGPLLCSFNVAIKASIDIDLIDRFLPRDCSLYSQAVSAVYAVVRCQSVRPSVRPSAVVTFVYCVKTIKRILKLFPQSGSNSKSLWQYSDGDPLTGAWNAGGYEKSRLLTKISLTGERRVLSTNFDRRVC